MPSEAVKQFPLEVSRIDHESGMSHLLRAFHANGVPMKRGFGWLRVSLGKPLRSVDARVLAWAARTPADWLSERLLLTPEHHDDRWYRLAGHRLSSAACSAGRTARLCPQCVQQSGCCNLSWMLRLVSGCARHGTLLIDLCPHCRLKIVWDRPAIDVCRCGHYLHAKEPRPSMPASVIAWVGWVERRLALADPSLVVVSDQDVPGMLGQLSLDGAMRLVAAFGLLRRSGDQPQLARAAARSNAGMAALVARGLERLRYIDTEPHRVSEIESLLHVPGIERLRAHGVDDADGQCAALLLRCLSDTGDRQRDGRGRYHRGQLPLFT